MAIFSPEQFYFLQNCKKTPTLWAKTRKNCKFDRTMHSLPQLPKSKFILEILSNKGTEPGVKIFFVYKKFFPWFSSKSYDFFFVHVFLSTNFNKYYSRDVCDFSSIQKWGVAETDKSSKKKRFLCLKKKFLE